MKELDGFKITENTYKTIEESKNLSQSIIPFLYVLNIKIDEIKHFYNLLLLNLEFSKKNLNQQNRSLI